MKAKILKKKNIELIENIQSYMETREEEMKKYIELFNKDNVEEFNSNDLSTYSRELGQIIGECNLYRQNVDNKYRLYNQTFLNENVNVAYRIEKYYKNRAVDVELNRFFNKSQNIIRKCYQKLDSREHILEHQGLFVNTDNESEQAKIYIYMRQIQFYVQQILQSNDSMKAEIEVIEYVNCELEDGAANDTDTIS